MIPMLSGVPNERLRAVLGAGLGAAGAAPRGYVVALTAAAL